MLRNRSKIPQNNRRNARKRNRRNADQSDESSWSSNDSESSQQDFSNEELFLEESSDSSFEDEDESVSPVIGRKLKTRRNRLNSKSKRSNKAINNRNRNSRSKKKSHRTSDSHTAGPSRINTNSRRSRSVNSNTRTAKRKYKDRSDDSETFSEICNTSSEEIDAPLFRIKKKRLRQAIPNTSESDDSVIQPAIARRRINLLDSESSTSASDEIRSTGRARHSSRALPTWSDTSSESIELNSQETSTTESSSLSSIQNTRRFRTEYLQTSDSGSSSSLLSNSLFSVDSEVANINSILDSEASSSYNTAQSTSSNNVDNKEQISDSDSSDSDGEKCAICLKKFRGQLIGNPSNCDHNFCFPCLQKWSESSTTCPVDRSTFDSITVRGEINGPVMDKVKVENRNFGVFPPLDVDEVLLHEAINCEICGSGDDEETLLLCDLCNLGYHMACLRPPLSAIPAGAWYCPPCFDFHDPAQNVEAFRFLSGLPERARVLLPSARRPNRIRTSNNRSRPNGPLPRGRGPTRGFRSHNLSNSRFQNLSNVIESVMANLNAASTSQSRRRRKRRNRQAASTTALQQSTTAENLETSSESKSRIIKKVNQRISNSGNNSNLIPRPRGPRDIVDMVFPSFSLFGGDDLDYFSDGPDEHDVDGEVAIMARVRNEYTARRLSNRKNIVTSLDNYHDRGAATASVEEITETPSSVNLLDTILESQTLWHSRNVEIKSKKDGSLEIKMKGEQNKKPDLTNTNHSSKEIPLFPNKGDGASGNKTYTNSNSRYSSLGNSSGGSGNSFSSSTSSFNNLNPSTRPGFSNLLGNNSSALDLSPFRGAAPIRFRMNPPRPMMRRQNYNSNSQRHPSNSSASLLNSVQSPKKSSNVGSAEEDVDLYDDIETENAENEKSQEIFASLEPPPEPPALLIGSDSSSDDENNGLVIDDNANKSNIYDPTDPNEDSDTENNGDKNSNMIPGYLRSPSYGGLSEFGPHLPLPEPPALPMELDSVKDSDEEEEAECPNMTLYSSTSINLANNVQDIPIPDAAYPQDELECIPIPTPSRDTNATKEETPVTKSDTNLYSPTDKNDSETSSLAEVEISSPKRSPRPRRENSEVRSISSRDSSRDLSDPSSGDESDRSRDYEKHTMKRSSRRRSVDKTRSRRHSSVNSASEVDSVQKDKPSKQIDLTEVDSNDEKDRVHSDDESGDSKADADEIADKYDITAVSGDIDDQDEGEKSDNEKDTVDKSPNDVASVKSANEDDKTDSEDEDKGDKATVEVDKEKAVEDTSVDTSLEAEGTDKVVEEEVNATPNDVAAPGNYLLPSEDLDPVSDVEYNDFSECQKSSSIRDKRKKRKKTRRRDSSTDNKTAAEAKELEEGEIEEEKSKRKYSSSQKKKGRSESPERSPDRRLKKKRDRKEKTTGKENKDTGAGGKSTGGAGGASREDLQWKKLSKNTKERNYRDGKAKPNDKNDKARDREIKSRKEKRKEIERYDVRKIVSDKPPRPVRDEFGRDVSINRSRSRTRSQSPSYMGRRRSKGTIRRSFSQEDRWINWSPVRNQRRSRSRTRRTRSRSRNRSRHSGDRYGNRSKNQDREREYDKREPRKRKRSVSSEIERYTPPPAELKKRRRSRDRSRKSESYAAGVIRPSGREREIPAEYYYERSRSWSRSLSYASLTPEPELYGRFSRSPSIIEPPTRIPLVSPTRDHNLMPQNPQNLTVIVPNVDLSKKKHKKKKDSKKKKKKQPSKEVFTSGDNIVVSVNFDDNQKIISAKSSKRKHDDEKSRKKKKDETRKRRKQALQVSDEVLNAKPVAVIDLNSSPCKEMSPTEVISLTDSGDEATVIIDNVIPTDRRIVSSQEDTGKSPVERRAYVMTQSGPKTPPEPPIKFVVNSTAPSRPLATNPIFEQDEIDPEDSLHYNKGPNTPPEPGNQQRRSISPSTTMYDPFEPTKSRSQSPENAQYDKDAASGVNVEERRPVIDMFSEDNDKPIGESQGSASAEKSKTQEENVKDNATATPTKSSTGAEDSAPSTNTKSPAKDSLNVESANETAQSNGVNTLVLDLSSLGDDFVPKSSIPLVKTSQGKYEFQSGKAPDKPITVVISQQSQAAKPQPQQVMVTPTRQVPTKQVEPIKQPLFPDLLPWKLPPPMSQGNFSTPPPTSSSLPSVNLMTPSKSAPGLLAQNGNQDESSFEVDDSPYSPASSEGDDLFEPPPLNASTASPNKQRPSPMPAINAFKSRVDALFSSSPIKKIPPRGNVQPHVSKPVSAIKGTKKILKPPIPSKKDPGIRADEEQLKILDDVPNSAVEMMVKEKFLKKLHRQERVVEEVKVVLKPHYAKKHITKEEYKDILRKAVPKICHNKSGDINPNKIQGLVQAYVKKVRHAKKKPTMGAGAPLFPPMKTTGKAMKPQKSLWG